MNKFLKYVYLKGFIDKSVALILLILLLPLFIAIIILINLTMGNPVFFTQKRVGYRCRSFTLIKFRTMKIENKTFNKSDQNDSKRISKTGLFLRKTSLDELPQLINIIKGDMSFIGPRPLLPEYLPLYSSFQLRRHEVTPGFSGLAQVNGRNNLSWHKRFAFDVYYVDNKNFFLDFKILLKTILVVLKSKGISTPGYATSPPFKGN